MKLKRIRLTNFRCFADLDLDVGQNIVLVGANNCGKSAVLSAIQRFWTSTNRKHAIVADDFHVAPDMNKAAELTIELFFDRLEQSAIDCFSEYTSSPQLIFRLKASLNAHGQIDAKFRGVRQGLLEFVNAFELSKITPINEFNDEYSRLAGLYEIPASDIARNKSLKISALREYEAANAEDLVEIESGDEAYGAVGPVPSIKRFFRFVYIPAVKDAVEESSEANNAMSELVSYAARRNTNFDERLAALQEVVRVDLLEMMEDQSDSLNDIQDRLNETLGSFLLGPERTELVWEEGSRGFNISAPQAVAKVNSEQFTGDVSSFGHGIQRAYILAVLKLVSEIDAEAEDCVTRLLIGFEEPELYQHPPQVDMLCHYLRKLAATHQTMITTHSPKFIIPDNFESVCRIVKEGGVSQTKRAKLSDLNLRMRDVYPKASEHLESTLASLGSLLTYQVPEIFFSKSCVIVEGFEDVGYLRAIKSVYGFDENFILSGLNIIPVGGKNEIVPTLEICRAFDIKAFVIFDSDSGLRAEAKKWESMKQTNYALFAQLDIAHIDGAIEESVLTDKACVWSNDFFDAVKNDWEGFGEIIEDHCSKFGVKKKQARAISTAVWQYAATKRCDNGDIVSNGKLLEVLTAITEFGAA